MTEIILYAVENRSYGTLVEFDAVEMKPKYKAERDFFGEVPVFQHKETAQEVLDLVKPYTRGGLHIHPYKFTMGGRIRSFEVREALSRGRKLRFWVIRYLGEEKKV